jgi:hypothetical protein
MSDRPASTPGRSVLLGVALAAATCATRPESREVADRFVDLYYARANLAEAVTLCTGAARTRLEGELSAIKGVPADAPADKPRVTWRLTSATTESPTAAKYTYRVEAHTSDVEPLVASLTLGNEGGRWRVTALDEGEGSP